MSITSRWPHFCNGHATSKIQTFVQISVHLYKNVLDILDVLVKNYRTGCATCGMARIATVNISFETKDKEIKGVKVWRTR